LDEPLVVETLVLVVDDVVYVGDSVGEAVGALLGEALGLGVGTFAV
jgi:pyrimidine operon attenuation protein/uracil phosphoribosyltransferase